VLLGLRTVVYPAPDLAAAKAWYATVAGKPPYFDESFYVGFEVGGFELGLVPDGTPGAGGPVPYWGVPDAAAAATWLAGLGATARGPVQDVGGGIKVAEFADPFGNVFAVIENPHFDPAKVR
jgi:predicted enzyme related to lactoylglutathione lyase